MNYVYTYGFIDTDTGEGVSIERACQCIEACAGMDDPAAEIERLRAERGELIAELEQLIAWDKKYPPQKIYPHWQAAAITNELTAIVKNAKAAIEKAKQTNP
jgi:hypothetical protein